MAKFLVFFVMCMITLCQIAPSLQSPGGRRVVRQDDLAFPESGDGTADNADNADTENRFGFPGNDNGGKRPNNNGWGNGGNQWGGGNGGNQWGNGNQNQQNRPRPTTTAAPPTTTASANPAAPDADCLTRCPVTPEYNPVCGTNRQTYINMSRLECARQCGLSITFLRTGTCRPLPVETA